MEAWEAGKRALGILYYKQHWTVPFADCVLLKDSGLTLHPQSGGEGGGSYLCELNEAVSKVLGTE